VRIFDPSLIAQRAAGNIDANVRDEFIEAQTQGLPLLRLDYWAPTRGTPKWAERASQVPSELDRRCIAPFGRPIPWETWDAGAECGVLVVHLTKQEVRFTITFATT
jgi:hypothetical protein